MSEVRIESFVSPSEVVADVMQFKEMWYEKHNEMPHDFPMLLGMYHWRIAHLGWTVMRNTTPSLFYESPEAWQGARVGVPDEHKPLADLNASRGFYVMVGTVALVLDLSGFDQAAVEFLSFAHHMGFDTGQLYMLVFDYVNSITSIDVPKGEPE